MRYVFSGLVGFFLTLVISVPLQQLLRLKEAQAVTMKAKNTWIGWQGNRLGEINVDLPPLGEVSADAREPRIKFMPQYPSEAVANQIEGYVKLTFQVNKDGTVRNIKVVDSQPPQVFDKVARRAVSRWMYGTAPGHALDSADEQKIKLVFNLKKNFASE